MTPGPGRDQLNIRVAPAARTALQQLAADLADLLGRPMSGGDALAWAVEVAAAEAERLRTLRPEAEPAACPWHLTARAIREYWAIAGCTSEGQAVRELEAIAVRCVDPDRQAEVRTQDNGLLLYRGPRPLRLRLLVDGVGEHATPEPTVLVQVLPASPRGARPEGAGAKLRKRARQHGEGAP